MSHLTSDIYKYILGQDYLLSWASLVAQTVENPPAMRETWVRSLGQEEPLEKRMATHLRILAGEFQGQRILVSYRPWCHRVRHD